MGKGDKKVNLRTALRCVMYGTYISIALLSAGCGESGSGSPTPTSTSTSSNVATLTSNVKIVNQSQADFVESQSGTDWVLRSPMDVKEGDVLLLDDAAVRVQSVTIRNGKTVLTVVPAEVEEVFAKLSVHQQVTLERADFVPESDNTGGTLQKSSGSAEIAAVFSGSERFHQPVNYGPFSGDLDLTLNTKLDFDYDETQDLTPHGQLDVTASTSASILASFAGKTATNFPEKALGTIRIPISYTLLDAALQVLGVRLASIQIPLTLGAEATVNGAVKVRLQGVTSSGVVVTYDRDQELSTTPTASAQFSVSGELSSEIPTAVAKGSVSLGPYLRAKPQLVILNKVASIGADIKAGIYARGQLIAYLTSPFYCLNLQGMTAGEIFGFARTIGANIKTKIFPNSADVGPPYVLGGQCQPSVEFSQSSYEASPSDTNATITVTLKGAATDVVTVEYKTSDVTALAGRDYTATTGTLRFSPSETSKTFSIPILKSSTSKGGTVQLTLSQPSSGTEIGARSTAELAINAASSVEFSLAAYSVEKTAGLVSISVRRTGDLSKSATVKYATSDGTARSGQDYTSKSGTLAFAAFDSAMAFDIPILNNPNTQVDRTINLSLSQPSNGTSLGTLSTAVLTIRTTSAVSCDSSVNPSKCYDRSPSGQWQLSPKPTNQQFFPNYPDSFSPHSIEVTRYLAGTASNIPSLLFRAPSSSCFPDDPFVHCSQLTVVITDYRGSGTYFIDNSGLGGSVQMENHYRSTTPIHWATSLACKESGPVRGSVTVAENKTGAGVVTYQVGFSATTCGFFSTLPGGDILSGSLTATPTSSEQPFE